MKSVFFNKPPRPKYVVIWDVTVVLKYLRSLMPLSRLSLKMLTFKTIALVALATAPRAQTLVNMKLCNMLKEQQAVVFVFSDVMKTSRVGHSFSLKIEHFKDEPICALHTLYAYIEATEKLRQSDYVFVSYVTGKKVTTSTVARWLKSVLQLSGIDVNCFKAHSFRSAASSAASSKGCSVKNILDTADWGSEKNFKKFYFRHSVKDLSFTNAVFNN